MASAKPMDPKKSDPKKSDPKKSDPNNKAWLGFRLLRYLVQNRSLFIFASMLYPVVAITVALPPYLVREILDKAVPEGNARLLVQLGLFYLGALILEYVAGFASQYVMGVLGQKAMAQLRADLFAHVQRLPSTFFDRTPVGRLLTRMTSDVEALTEFFAAGAVTMVADVLTVAAVVFMMLALDSTLTLYAFLVVPPLVLIAAVFQRFARQAFSQIRRALARLNGFLAEHLGGISIVQVYGQEARTVSEFEALGDDYRRANHQAIRFDAALYSIVEGIGTIAAAAMVGVGAGRLSLGLVKAGTLVAFIQYIRRFFIPIRDLSTKYTILQSALAAAERIFTLLDRPVEAGAQHAGKKITHLRDGIAFSKVWFRYGDPQEEEMPWVLRGLDLQLGVREKLAVVGATGSGKTSLLRLLNRTYTHQKGDIWVDGVSIKDWSLGDIRRLFAIVPQDVYFFSGTIADNLALSGDIARVDVDKAVAALEVDVMLKGLPLGLDTEVAALGNNFSAGERQLLALARALALNPSVMILDEATSNVDSETEVRIQRALDVALQDRAALVVAHRLSTVRKMDRILVMDKGQIVQSGSHDELMAQVGLYRTLVEEDLVG